MKIDEIRKLEQRKSVKDDLEKYGKLIALFSGIIGIFALIFNLSSNMKEVEGTLDFLSGPIGEFLYYSSIILLAIFLIVIIFFVFIFSSYFLWRFIPSFWGRLKVIREIKSRINYKDLESKAKELIKLFPRHVLKHELFFLENVFTYTGITLVISTYFFDQDELLLCKTQDFHGNFQIVGSDLPEEILQNYPDVSRFHFYWDFYLKRFLNEGWEKITLKSTWTDGEFIIKQCLRKDDYLLIYDIEKKKTLEI